MKNSGDNMQTVCGQELTKEYVIFLSLLSIAGVAAIPALTCNPVFLNGLQNSHFLTWSLSAGGISIFFCGTAVVYSNCTIPAQQPAAMAAPLLNSMG